MPSASCQARPFLRFSWRGRRAGAGAGVSGAGTGCTGAAGAGSLGCTVTVLPLGAAAGAGAELWLYALQYLPVTLALCYSYERSGCLWTPILLHMFNNVMAYAGAG